MTSISIKNALLLTGARQTRSKMSDCLPHNNVQKVGKITYFPIYMIMFIKPVRSDIGIYKFDLYALY